MTARPRVEKDTSIRFPRDQYDRFSKMKLPRETWPAFFDRMIPEKVKVKV